jgi:hypothetical protein
VLPFSGTESWWTANENIGPVRGEESEQFRVVNIRRKSVKNVRNLVF